MLTAETIEQLDRFRHAERGTPVCPAPAMNLHFSQLGVVTACCFNRTQVLGIYPQHSVSEIWHGQPIRELREALAGYDLTRGCEKCAQQIEARDFGGAHAVFYHNYAQATVQKRKEWGMHPDGNPDDAPQPMRLEFNIHNACNLQCVMCHGLASSSIRSHREGLPSLANPYDETFAEQLEPFLPYVVETDFMGGEPFMIAVYRSIWERIARVNPLLKTCILTNGTILDDSIKELLETFNCWMHVSIDSVKKETYESIRRGSSYDTVMENCRWFSDLMKSKGFTFMFRYCPMRQNWRELPDTIRFCDDNDITIMFNQVDSPLNFSLHTLPTYELQAVVSHLERNAPPVTRTEAGLSNQIAYRELVERLAGFLDGNNRLNGLRARLDVSDAVVGQYTKNKKMKVARGVTVPVPDEEKNPLIEAVKRYVITRLNIDQVLRTDDAVPDDFANATSARIEELEALASKSDDREFVDVFLAELVRTYSGVWGVRKVHDRSIFETIREVAAAVAGRPDRQAVVQAMLAAAPGDLYRWLSDLPGDEVVGRLVDAVEDRSTVTAGAA